jgi:hypothetical protein
VGELCAVTLWNWNWEFVLVNKARMGLQFVSKVCGRAMANFQDVTRVRATF